MDGKWRREASEASSAQKTRAMRSVFWLTGSEVSPPGGETAPTTVIEPVRASGERVTTRPARS